MANPITAIASRSCAKNSMLKQTKGEEKDLSTGSGAQTVSTTVTPDAAQNIGGGRSIIGDQTDTTITSPGSGDSTTYATENIEQAKGGNQATDLDKYFKGLYARFGDKVTTQELIDKKYISPSAADAYDKVTGGQNLGVATVTPGTQPSEKKDTEFKMDQEQVKGMGNIDLRRDIREEKIFNRLDRQAERRQDRFERKAITDADWKGKKDVDGNEYKSKGQYKQAMRQQQKIDKAKSNIERQQNVQNLIADRRALKQVQTDQGSFGREKYYVGKNRENQDGLVNRLEKRSFTPTQVTATPSGKTQFTSSLNMNDFALETPDITKISLNGMPKRGPIKKGYFKK